MGIGRFHCSVQESQTALLQLAAKYAEPLPYANSDCAAQLEVEAARQRLQDAEEQLRHAQQREQGQPLGRQDQAAAGTGAGY